MDSVLRKIRSYEIRGIPLAIKKGPENEIRRECTLEKWVFTKNMDQSVNISSDISF